jgi:hypothetical protein
MQMYKPWKTYNDDWNAEFYTLDCNFKKEFIENNKVEDTITSNESNVDDTVNHKNTVNLVSFDDLNKIISITDFKSLHDLNILDNIIKVITWCIQNFRSILSTIDNKSDEQSSSVKIGNLINGLQWILKAIDYFITELNIEKISKDYNGLNRSSYKLCPNKSNCIYQYPDNKTYHFCKYKHFPYDNLYLDCSSIITYINSLVETTNSTSRFVKAFKEIENDGSGTGSSFNELNRCLTTLNYVFLIIYRELELVNKTRKNEPNYNIRKYHNYNVSTYKKRFVKRS